MKSKSLILLIAIFCTSISFTQPASAATCAEGGVCALGEIGPGGGKVFYVAATAFSSGAPCGVNCLYLEMAPNTWSNGTTDPSLKMQPNKTRSPANGNTRNNTAIGLGFENTSALLSNASGISDAKEAIYSVDILTTGKTDWYIQNSLEYLAMKTYLDSCTTACANFTYNSRQNYWSSNYKGNAGWDFKWAISGLDPGNPTLNNSKPIRPIRAFAGPLLAPAFTLSSSAISATAGTAITSYAITSTGGAIASYSISPTIGNGLSFSTATGLISGTPTSAADAATYTITATNATAPAATTTFAITVTAALLAPAFTLSSSAISATAGTAITSYAITSTGGAIASYSISPTIGNGLSFSTATGLISGTPTSAADAATYTITATNATAPAATTTFAITVTAAAVVAPVLTPEERSTKEAAAAAAEEARVIAQARAEAQVQAEQAAARKESAKQELQTALQSNRKPTSQTLKDAGLEGITDQNLNKVNEKILTLPALQQTNLEEIQKIITIVTFFDPEIAPTVEDFSAQGIQILVPERVDKVAEQLLLIPENQQGDISLIKKIVTIVTFFDSEITPTIEDFKNNGISTVQEKIIDKLADELLLVPENQQGDISVIKKIVVRVQTVDKLSTPETGKTVQPSELIAIGAISPNSSKKTTITSALRKLDPAQVDTYQKVLAAVAMQEAIIKARADRSAAIKAKIVARAAKP